MKQRILGDGLELREGLADTAEALRAIPPAVLDAIQAIVRFPLDLLGVLKEDETN